MRTAVKQSRPQRPRSLPYSFTCAFCNLCSYFLVFVIYFSMKKCKAIKKDILPYVISSTIITVSAGIIILFCLLLEERLTALTMPAFAPSKALFCLLFALCALPQSYTLGKTLAQKQMRIFYTLAAVHTALAIWALLFFCRLILSALIIIFAASVALNVISFRLTNKKGVRWLTALPYTLWILYVLFLNYSIALIN